MVIFYKKSKNITQQVFSILFHLAWNDNQSLLKKGRKFYLMTHSTHFIYGYMASKICLDDGGPS